MGLTDTKPRKVPRVARPAAGKSYIDPVHGNTVWRVTDAAAEGYPAIVPPYSNRPFARTDRYGDLFLLYRKGNGGGHRLYHAGAPYSAAFDVPWGSLMPDEPEAVWFADSLMYWMTFDGRFLVVDLDGGAVQEIFRVTSPTNEVFADTHGLPSTDGTRVAVSWYTSSLEKRLAVVDLRERRVLWEMPYLTPQVTGFQKRTGTPMMALDGQFFTVPFPRPNATGVYFYTFRFDAQNEARLERILCADYTYEHSCQAQIPISVGTVLDIYVSKTNGGPAKNPSSFIPGKETSPAFCLVSSFEHSTKELPTLSAFVTLFSPPTWGGVAGVHLTGGAWSKPSRIAFSCFAPANKTYRYGGELLAAGHQEIVVVDLDVALATGGGQGFERICHHRSAAQMSDVFGNSAYWAEPHPILSPDGSMVVYGSDFNFDKPESEWTHGIDTYIVEVA